MSDAILFFVAFVITLLVCAGAARLRMGRGWRPVLRRAVTIDGNLLAAPRRMTQACLPFDPAEQPRLRSGALLWASAATVTHTLAHDTDREAILAAVKPLGFTPEKFLARCPILGQVEMQGQQGFVVRDGSGYRAYFLGEPAALLGGCTFVWDQQERPRTADDSARLPSPCAGQYALAMAPADDDGVGPLTYLGSMRIEAQLKGVETFQKLIDHGVEVYITPGDEPALQPQLQALCTIGQPPRHGLTVENPGSADAAQQTLDALHTANVRQHHLLCIAWLVLCLAAAAAVYALPWYSMLLCIPLLIPCALETGSFLLHSRRRTVLAAAAAMLASVLLPWSIAWFTTQVAPDVSALPLALIAASLVAGFSRSAWGILFQTLAAAALGWILCAAASLPLLLAFFCTVAGFLHGVLLYWLLSRKFSRFGENYS